MKELLNGLTRRKEHGGKMIIFDLFKIVHGYIPIICFGAIVFVGVVIISDKMSKKSKPNELEEASPDKANGIIFGKVDKKKLCFSPVNSEGHVVVMGGSGLGKTSALLIPTLRSWTGTSLTVDISGDISKNVDMPHKLVYEPENPKSIPYNIFGPIDCLSNEDDKNEALEALAFLMMPDDEKMADTAKFFHTEGRKILTASLIAFYHVDMDFIPICERIVESSWKELFNAIDSTGYAKGMRYINSFLGASEQNTAGCKQAADAVLKLFATNERIKKSIRRPKQNEASFTPERLEESNVFVVIDDSKLKLYSPLLHILVAQSLDFFSTRSNDSTTTILFCLDEFASLGKIEITDALRKLRKKHIRILMLTQSMADVDLIYGRDERMAMMNNYRFKVILGADDSDTQEYFAKLIGYQETKKHSTSSSATQTTHTESEAREWAIEPAELARLGDELVLLHPNGYMKLQKNYYFK